jgi:hypothetical protein
MKKESSLGFLSKETTSTEVQSPTGDGVGGLGKGKQEEVNHGMADELGDLCKRISLTEGERDGIQVEELDVLEAKVIEGEVPDREDLGRQER